MSDTLRILLVDDDSRDRSLAIRELRRGLGAVRIGEATTEAELARALETTEFDVVVTDYDLGWTNGLQVLRRARERRPDCPVILFSRGVPDPVVHDAIRAGVSDCVLKNPGGVGRLARSVRAAIRHAGGPIAELETGEVLRRSRRQFHALIEHGSDLIGVLERDRTIRYVSPSVPAFLRQPLTAIVGRDILDFVHPDDRERVRDLFDAVARAPLDHSVATNDVRITSPDDSSRILEGLLVNTLDDPAIAGIVMTARDVTANRKAEEELRRKEEQFLRSQRMEAVGRLAGGVAHDFNNLLTAIACFNDVVMRSLAEGDPLREHGAEIRKAVSRASGLTRQLLAFSRRQVLQPKVIDLGTVVADVEPMLRRLIGEDVDLRIVTDGLPARTSADPGQIEQVVLNLVVNARDAMPHGGCLTIATGTTDSLPDEICDAGEQPEASRGPWSRLAVTDTGAGIAEEVRETLFEPFVTTKGPGRGTGLGLSTVHGIVHQSGGRIAVRSRPGKGTTFEIVLPAVAASEPPVRPHVPDSPRRPQGRETILLVEDEEMVRVPVSTVLRQGGYVVLEARSGAEAIELVRQNRLPVDLLLTDLVMPGMSGAQLAERILALSPRTRVLCTSGYTDHAALEQGLLARDTSFLHKPFSPDTLLARVRAVLDAAPHDAGEADGRRSASGSQ